MFFWTDIDTFRSDIVFYLSSMKNSVFINI